MRRLALLLVIAACSSSPPPQKPAIGGHRFSLFPSRNRQAPSATPAAQKPLECADTVHAIKLFDVIYVMTGGGPGSSTYTASFYLYQIGFQQFHLSKATAGSWIFLLLSAILILALVRRLLRPEAR